MRRGEVRDSRALLKRRRAMSQIEIWHGLEREVRAAGNVCLFNQAKVTSAALANYATTENVMAALHGPTRASIDERQLLIEAILGQHQAVPRALWTAMLALTFRPMLSNIARKLSDVAHGDREPTAVFAFIETIAELTPGKGTIFRLYWATRRRVIRPLRRARLKAQRTIAFVEEDFCPTSQSMEALIDGARFARQVAAAEPREGESARAYVTRVGDINRLEDKWQIRAALRHKRTSDLISLREQLQHCVNG
jgi:hypothetical protein